MAFFKKIISRVSNRLVREAPSETNSITSALEFAPTRSPEPAHVPSPMELRGQYFQAITEAIQADSSLHLPLPASMRTVYPWGGRNITGTVFEAGNLTVVHVQAGPVGSYEVLTPEQTVGVDLKRNDTPGIFKSVELAELLGTDPTRPSRPTTPRSTDRGR